MGDCNLCKYAWGGTAGGWIMDQDTGQLIYDRDMEVVQTGYGRYIWEWSDDDATFSDYVHLRVCSGSGYIQGEQIVSRVAHIYPVHYNHPSSSMFCADETDDIVTVEIPYKNNLGPGTSLKLFGYNIRTTTGSWINLTSVSTRDSAHYKFVYSWEQLQGSEWDFEAFVVTRWTI